MTGRTRGAITLLVAGAALTVVTDALGAGKAEVFAQRLEQRRARFKAQDMLLSVDVEGDLNRTWARWFMGGRGCWSCFRRRPGQQAGHHSPGYTRCREKLPPRNPMNSVRHLGLGHDSLQLSILRLLRAFVDAS